MVNQTLLDLATDDAGDLQIGPDGDFLVVRNEDVIAQEVLWRVKTTRGDWLLEPECGADLESLIGEPNSPQTGALMEALITRALTHDGFLGGELKQVKAVPVNRNSLVALITIDYNGHAFTQTISLDLKQGIL